MRYKLLSETAKVPTRADDGSAGYDLYADVKELIYISPGDTVKITTNIAMEIPKGFFGGVFARSGLATKKGLRPANCVGIIDPSYRGPIIVPIHNDSNEHQAITPGDRIAQLIFIPYQKYSDFLPKIIIQYPIV